MSELQMTSTRDRAVALWWLLGMLVVPFVCQLALLVPALNGYRVVFRTAAFAISLLALLFVPGRPQPNPVRLWLVSCLLIVMTMMMHTQTNSALSGLAQVTLYLAIMAPLFWVGRLRISPDTFFIVTLVFWLMSTASAVVGVLQTLYPGRFQMPITNEILRYGMAEGLKITLADGSRMYRPTGLTDSPGGASSAGFMAYVFGLGFLTTSKRWPLAVSGAVAIGIGLYCIYIAQVRVHFILALACTLIFCVGLVRFGRFGSAWRRLIILPLVLALSTTAAIQVGGAQVTSRLATLVADDPGAVYRKNRGQFLEEAFVRQLPTYPFGAGLGRWGMVRSYFGTEGNLNSPPIWVEIQFSAWVLDGGLPLLFCYSMATVLALAFTLRQASQCTDSRLKVWGLLVAGYSLSIIAVMFSYVPFIGQLGLEYWLLNAAYWTTVHFQSVRTQGLA